jgi:spore cortex formation protein SpoVR/YcgB (stage V sporulation)
MSDIRRVCENPTEEDRRWFPEMAGGDWIKALDFAMRNFKDESFIAQYLSPKVIRDFKLFSVLDDDSESELEITHIHDEQGYREVRFALSEQNNVGNYEPSIQVYRVDTRGDRSLTLRHYQHDRRPLGETTHEMMKHIRRLWGFKVRLETVDKNGRPVKTYECE